MSLRDRLIKNSTIKETTLLSDSKIYAKKDVITTRVPLINAALSADFDGGLLPGLFLLAGPSKHFKSNFAILMAKAFMDKNPDGVILFYDSEFGTPESYFKDMNIDNIVHTPIMDVEQLKHDIVNQLKSIEKNDKVFILVDSLGNLASKKELDDAEEGKTVADMTRAKSFKSLFRMVTPYLNTKDIPMVAIMHTYEEMCLAGETLIKTTTGLKKIKDIKENEFVYSLNGINKVLATFGPEELDASNKRFFELTFDDGSVVRCTNNHRFLVSSKEWREAENLKIGDEMF